MDFLTSKVYDVEDFITQFMFEQLAGSELDEEGRLGRIRHIGNARLSHLKCAVIEKLNRHGVERTFASSLPTSPCTMTSHIHKPEAVLQTLKEDHEAQHRLLSLYQSQLGAGDDAECALVSDQEIEQIIRGEVSSRRLD